MCVDYLKYIAHVHKLYVQWYSVTLQERILIVPIDACVLKGYCNNVMDNIIHLEARLLLELKRLHIYTFLLCIKFVACCQKSVTFSRHLSSEA